MKISIRKGRLWLVLGCLLSVPALWPTQIVVPESINHLCYYTDFFYNLPKDDFIYYLNDRLLYSEPPDDELFDSGLRSKLEKIILIHDALGDFVAKHGGRNSQIIHFNLNSAGDEEAAIQLCILLGLEMRKEEDQTYSLMLDTSEGIVDYHRLANLNLAKLEKQINETKQMTFQLRQSLVDIPYDLEFLNEITGLELTPHTFLKEMVSNERFSLLLGTLYRLSHQEVEYISDAMPEKANGAWEAIYKDKKWLTGMFMLSTALRVSDDRLMIPGGDQAARFWTTLVGADPVTSPVQFLKALATEKDGKLNYLFVFSHYLPEQQKTHALFDYDARKMAEILDVMELAKHARLQISRLPRLDTYNFFSWLYLLRVENDAVWFPGGIGIWLDALAPELGMERGDDTAVSDSEKMFRLLRTLVAASKADAKGMTPLEKFVSLYAKFIDRPQIIRQNTLETLFKRYENFNVMVDYIEKLPLKNPQTVHKMFSWLDDLSKLGRPSDIAAFTAIYQSMLEILSFQAKYAPDHLDYDLAVQDLLDIPLQAAKVYDGLFQFLSSRLNIRLNRRSIDDAFLNAILVGIPNQYIQMNDQAYRFMVQDQVKEYMEDIIQSQEVAPLSTLLEINDAFKAIAEQKPGTAEKLNSLVRNAFLQLPHPDISDSAPKFIRNRVKSYLKEDLDKDVLVLEEKIQSRAPAADLNEIMEKIKGTYLIHQLKDSLVTVVYALHAKNPRLRIFLNPNLVRLHDFEGEDGITAWNHCGIPRTKKRFSGFFFQGGLSRLSLLLCHAWREHLFARNIIYDKEQIEAVLANILDIYPILQASRTQDYISLLVEFGLELIQKSQKDEAIAAEVREALGTVIAGYHYRKIMDYLDEISNDYYLFFHEIYKLGEVFLRKNHHLEGFSSGDRLGMLTKTHLYQTIKKELNQYGGIHYHTFGAVTPRYMNLFPQELGNLFLRNSTGGEILNEFKIKTAYHASKKGFAPQLLGQFLYEYLYATTRKYYSQNYIKDYFSTYFIFDILNNSNLSKIIKKLQSKGHVRLK